MDDDLNVAGAMGAVFTLIRALNRELDAGTVTAPTHAALLELIDEVDDVLGVLALVERERAGEGLSDQLSGLLDAREAARAARDWAESDRLRDELAGAGNRRRGHAGRTALAQDLTQSLSCARKVGGLRSIDTWALRSRCGGRRRWPR